MIEDTLCPLCGGPMTSRKNSLTGQRFWGCNAYPTCRGMRNTDGDADGDRPTPGEGSDRDLLPSDRLRQNDRHRWR